MREVTAITPNGKRYRRPRRPTVVVCVDDFDPAYLGDGIRSRTLPALAGFATLADAVMPTFTNPNNLSIVTGAAPDVPRQCQIQ